MDPAFPGLLRGVDLLCLDAGNTIVFLDHARLAVACTEEGFSTAAGVLNRAEGQTKLRLDEGRLGTFAWSQGHVPSSRSWGAFMGTLLLLAGLAAADVPRVLEGLWRRHRAKNFWHLVPAGLAGALAEVRAAGVPVAVVSNSEGMLRGLLDDVGLLALLDLVIDSGIVGVEKPDARIFRLALDHFGVGPARALHLGDTFGTDVVGARAAGVRVALVDPYGHLDGRHPDVPRVPGVVEVARSIALRRAG